MPKTLALPLSEAAIKRYLSRPDIAQLKDPKRCLYLRYNAARTGASWTLVLYRQGRTYRRKVGRWPDQTLAALVKRLPDIRTRLIAELEQASLQPGAYDTLDQVLTWYRDRNDQNQGISARRRAAVRSIINRHLLPALTRVPLLGCSRQALDAALIWPAQARYSHSYIKAMLGVLKVATAQAHRLQLIEADPLAGFKLGDFLTVSIRPKPGAFTLAQLPDLVQRLPVTPWPARVLVSLLLCHGTRIGETRQARWAEFDLVRRHWTIPAGHTKNNTEHRLPLTPAVVALLHRYRDYQQGQGYQGVFLFPSLQRRYRTANRHPVSDTTAGKWVKRLSDRAWSAHDLRKFARSTWLDLGVDYLVAELLLNHTLTQLDQTYIHTHAEEQKRRALNTYSRFLQQHQVFTGIEYRREPLPGVDLLTGEIDSSAMIEEYTP